MGEKTNERRLISVNPNQSSTHTGSIPILQDPRNPSPANIQQRRQNRRQFIKKKYNQEVRLIIHHPQRKSHMSPSLRMA
jgi:hypothetical protein